MSETRNKGGRPRIDATPVTVRVPPHLLSELDAWIATQPPPKPTRPEAIRRMAMEWLQQRGGLEPK